MVQKVLFLCWSTAPDCFLAQKVLLFFFFRYVNFWPLYSIFPGGILGVLLLFFHFGGYLAKFWPVLGTFLLHVKKWTSFILFLIPLGIGLNFCQNLTQNWLQIIGLGPFWEIFRPNFGPLFDFCCLFLGIILFLIPLGIRLNFCQKLTQNGLQIIVLGPFWEIFSPFLDHCLTYFA